jgi:Family of unknown function (DUF5689)
MNTKKIIFALIAFIGISYAFSSCVKEEFDNPPSNCDDIHENVTFSIQQLKTMMPAANYDTLKLGDSIIIEGTVTSSDQYGNFYKELIIEDTSGAIAIQIDYQDMFTEFKFPVGQKIYVKCGGLYLGNSYGIAELGGLFLDEGSLEFGRIVDEEVIEEHLIRTCDNNHITPIPFTIPETNNIPDNELYQLIIIENVQFKEDELDNTWADWVNQGYGKSKIIDENGNTLIVQSSGFCSFARDSLPKGSGNITGILGTFSGAHYISVRSTDDAVFDKERFEE